MAIQKSSHVAVQAFKILRSLYQLSTDLHASENRQDLIFRIVNGTIDLFPYRRAVLWSFNGKKTTLLAISGRDTVNKQSPIAKLWTPIVNEIKKSNTVHVVKQAPEGLEKEWDILEKKTSGLSVMWVPIVGGGTIQAGLWLERWGNDVWDPSECEIMNSYTQNLRLAWKQFSPKHNISKNKILKPKKITFAIMAVIMAILVYFPIISLRVVAPCEVMPKDPEIVTAPLEGVIKEVMVKPGDFVKKGDLLFLYEDRFILQELKVAQKQVEIIKSQYDRMRFKSFIDQDAMQEIQSLKFRLEQEQIRLKLAESNANHLKIKAELDGVCMVDHPEKWRGRPVQIGERVLMIFTPEQSKVQILLPEKDNIDFDLTKPVTVILNVSPAKRFSATLNFVAPQTSEGPKGGVYFLAEAFWLKSDTSIKVGSKGTAIVYGEKVSVIYWFLRKPVAGVRQFIGL